MKSRHSRKRFTISTGKQKKFQLESSEEKDAKPILQKNLFRAKMLETEEDSQKTQKGFRNSRRYSASPRPKHTLPLASICLERDKRMNFFSARYSNKKKNLVKTSLQKGNYSYTNNGKDEKNSISKTRSNTFVKTGKNEKNLKINTIFVGNVSYLSKINTSENKKKSLNSLTKKEYYETTFSDGKRTLKGIEHFRMTPKAELINKMIKTKTAWHQAKPEVTEIPYFTQNPETIEKIKKIQNSEKNEKLKNSEKRLKKKILRNVSFLFEKKKSYKPKPKSLITLLNPEDATDAYADNLSQIRSVLGINNFPTLSENLFGIINKIKLSYEKKKKIQNKAKKSQKTISISDKLCRYISSKKVHGCHERQEFKKILSWVEKMKNKYSNENYSFNSIEEYFLAFKDILAFSQRELIEEEKFRCKEKSELIFYLYQENLSFFNNLMDYLGLFLLELDKNHIKEIKDLKDEHEEKLIHQEFRYSVLENKVKMFREEMEEMKLMSKKLRNKLSSDVLVMKQLRSDVEFAGEREGILRIENEKLMEIIVEIDTEMRVNKNLYQNYYLINEKIKSMQDVQQESQQKMKLIEEEKARRDIIENSRLSKSDKARYHRNANLNSGIVDLALNTYNIGSQTNDINRSEKLVQANPECKHFGSQISNEFCENCKKLRVQLFQEEFARKLLVSKSKRMSKAQKIYLKEMNKLKQGRNLEVLPEESKVDQLIDILEHKSLNMDKIEELHSKMKEEEDEEDDESSDKSNLATEKSVRVEHEEEKKKMGNLILDLNVSENLTLNEVNKIIQANEKLSNYIKHKLNKIEEEIKKVDIKDTETLSLLKASKSKFSHLLNRLGGRNRGSKSSDYIRNKLSNYFRSLSKRKVRSRSNGGNQGRKYSFFDNIRLANQLFNEVLEDIKHMNTAKKNDVIREITLSKQISKFYSDYANSNKTNVKTLSFKIQIFKNLSLQTSHKKVLVRNFKQVRLSLD